MGEPFGPYRIFEQIGAGGMATVHRAEATFEGLPRTVALKRLLPTLARDTTYIRRFVDEARLGQCLRHNGIARTYEVGCIDGVHFIAFEYVHGVTLLRLIQHSMTAGPVPVDAAVHIVTQVARALAYAHGARSDGGLPLNLIHRDIAPSNIIISHTGVTKLIDFGVAKATTTHVRTGVSSVIGKLGYVAPEYLRGQLDPRADVFSLGVVAHELLTSRRLYDGEDLETAETQRGEQPEPPSRQNPLVPHALDAIVLRALQREPRDRWPTAYAMYTALCELARDRGLATTDREVAAWLAITIEPPAPATTAAAPAKDIELEIDDALHRLTEKEPALE